jgi:hypothetical protein
MKRLLSFQNIFENKTTEKDVKVGDILTHKSFGEGEVLAVNKNIVKIDFFESGLGIKKILFKPEYFNWNTADFN